MKSKIAKMKLLLSISILLMSSSIYAQGSIVKKEKERFNHSLGFGAGVSTGYGLSYRYFGKKLGAQVNFSPYKDENKVIISSGLTFFLRMLELDEVSFFVYQANHFYYNKESYSYDHNYSGEKVSYRNEQKYFNNGAGIGIEWTPHNRIGINIMGGYGGQENFDKISFTGETGVYFKF
jgi:hypothetical protein